MVGHEARRDGGGGGGEVESRVRDFGVRYLEERDHLEHNEPLGFKKCRALFLLTRKLLVSQKGLCSMQLGR